MHAGDPLSQIDYFTDGLWHTVIIDVAASVTGSIGKVNITVDGRSDVSSRKLTFSSSTNYLIGGMFPLLFISLTMKVVGVFL